MSVEREAGEAILRGSHKTQNAPDSCHFSRSGLAIAHGSGKPMREGLIQVELLNSRGDRAVYWIPAAPEARPGLRPASARPGAGNGRSNRPSPPVPTSRPCRIAWARPIPPSREGAHAESGWGRAVPVACEQDLEASVSASSVRRFHHPAALLTPSCSFDELAVVAVHAAFVPRPLQLFATLSDLCAVRTMLADGLAELGFGAMDALLASRCRRPAQVPLRQSAEPRLVTPLSRWGAPAPAESPVKKPVRAVLGERPTVRAG